MLLLLLLYAVHYLFHWRFIRVIISIKIAHVTVKVSRKSVIPTNRVIFKVLVIIA